MRSAPWCRLSYMARKQTRRSISINRLNYEVTQQAAATRGMTVAGLVEFALGAIGIPVVVHPQQSPELVEAITARRGAPAVLRRRSVSLNRRNYEAVKREAAVRGMAIAALVELALASIGVPVVMPSRPSSELVSVRADQERRSIASQDGGLVL